MTVYVEALSLVNALGDDDDAILANLAQGRAPGMEGPLVRTVDGFEAPFGRVTIDLSETPSDSGTVPTSRNNRLLHACWLRKKTEFEERLKDFDDARIAVVLGTSTSGSPGIFRLVEGGKVGRAFAALSGRMAGNGRSVARLRGLCRRQGPGLHDRHGLHELGSRHHQRGRLLEAGLADAVIAAAPTPSPTCLSTAFMRSACSRANARVP